MSWWTRAWGQMSTRDSALPPWPVMLVSHRPSCRGRHLRRGRVPALHDAGPQRAECPRGPVAQLERCPYTMVAVPSPLDVSLSPSFSL